MSRLDTWGLHCPCPHPWGCAHRAGDSAASSHSCYLVPRWPVLASCVGSRRGAERPDGPGPGDSSVPVLRRVGHCGRGRILDVWFANTSSPRPPKGWSEGKPGCDVRGEGRPFVFGERKAGVGGLSEAPGGRLLSRGLMSTSLPPHLPFSASRSPWSFLVFLDK